MERAVSAWLLNIGKGKRGLIEKRGQICTGRERGGQIRLRRARLGSSDGVQRNGRE